MQRTGLLLLLELLLSIISGFLISKISFLGKVGIRFFYQEYSIFRSWWKTALLLFTVQLTLILLQKIIRKRSLSWTLLIGAITGLTLTFMDFSNTFSHRILREKFHAGFYLFWLGWIVHCIYFLLHNKQQTITK